MVFDDVHIPIRLVDSVPRVHGLIRLQIENLRGVDVNDLGELERALASRPVNEISRVDDDLSDGGHCLSFSLRDI